MSKDSRGCTEDKTFEQKLSFYLSLSGFITQDLQFYFEQARDLTEVEAGEFYSFLKVCRPDKLDILIETRKQQTKE